MGETVNKVEIYPGVFMIPEFITEEEQEYLINLADSATEDNWKEIWWDDNYGRLERVFGDDPERLEYEKSLINPFWEDKVISIKNDELTNRLMKRLEGLYDNENFRYNDLCRIQRQYPGSQLKVHHDQGYNMALQKAIIVYVNDNYEGGELWFPDHKFEIKPPARSLITFPGTDEYMHGVKDVTGTVTRYVLPSFAFDTTLEDDPRVYAD